MRSPGTTGDSISDEQLQRLQQYYIDKGCTPDVVAADIVKCVMRSQSNVYTGPLAKTTAWLKRLFSIARFRKLLLENAKSIGYLAAK